MVFSISFLLINRACQSWIDPTTGAVASATAGIRLRRGRLQTRNHYSSKFLCGAHVGESGAVSRLAAQGSNFLIQPLFHVLGVQDIRTVRPFRSKNLVPKFFQELNPRVSFLLHSCVLPSLKGLANEVESDLKSAPSFDLRFTCSVRFRFRGLLFIRL